MPVLNQNILNKVQYLNMGDYVSSMDSLDDIKDKMDFTVAYLLAYGRGQRRDVRFEEAVQVARYKIADASAALRFRKGAFIPDEAVDPNLSDEEDAPYRKFMIDPIGYLKDETNRLIALEAENGNDPKSQQRLANYNQMMVFFSSDHDNSLSNRIGFMDLRKPQAIIKARLNGKYHGKLDEAYEKTKPSFLSKTFGTYSLQYRHLDEVYNAFNNPKHALYGDVAALDKAASDYLKHALPSWDPKTGLPDMDTLNALSGTKKERAVFSLNILTCTAQQRRCENVYETIKNANIQKRAEAEAGVKDDPLEEAQFQRRVLNDSAENNIEYDDSKAAEDYAANFAPDPEEVQEEGMGLKN